MLEAHSLEQEAQAVDSQIREWLQAGKSAIAVIAQDRLVARRARALLERGQILVADETGWTFSTVAASAVVMRWLDAMASRFHHLDLLDLLKSPLIFADWEGGARKHAVYGLEQLVRRHSVISGLHHYRSLAQREGADDVLTLLARLDQAQARFGARKRGLAAWLASLLESLEVLGLHQGLAQDLAGEQLLRLLERLQKELGQDQGLFSLSEWRRWLDSQLEAATFRDTGITSPVVFTHLGAARLRRFDGVIVAGGDAAHFPGRGKESAFFNQSVRAQLGLPTFEQDLRRMEQDFTALLADCGTLLITWQGRKNAEPNLASPWVERLEVFHELAYGEKLPRRVAEQPGEAAGILVPSPASVPARPCRPNWCRPALSASGYNSLMACPYQFYARHALHLNELDEVQQALEKKDYGEHVHAILHHFHQRYPAIGGCDRAEMEQALSRHQPGRIPPGAGGGLPRPRLGAALGGAHPGLSRLAGGARAGRLALERGRTVAHAGTGAGRGAQPDPEGPDRPRRYPLGRWGRSLRRAGLQDPEPRRPAKEAGSAGRGRAAAGVCPAAGRAGGRSGIRAGGRGGD